MSSSDRGAPAGEARAAAAARGPAASGAARAGARKSVLMSV
jgi:hypothetical protein